MANNFLCSNTKSSHTWDAFLLFQQESVDWFPVAIWEHSWDPDRAAAPLKAWNTTRPINPNPSLGIQSSQLFWVTPEDLVYWILVKGKFNNLRLKMRGTPFAFRKKHCGTLQYNINFSFSNETCLDNIFKWILIRQVKSLWDTSCLCLKNNNSPRIYWSDCPHTELFKITVAHCLHNI